MRMCEAMKRPPSRPGIRSRYCMPARPTYHASFAAFRRLITNSLLGELIETFGIKDNERQNQPSLPRLEMDTLSFPALKSRAKLNRRCRDEEVLLQLFFKHHKSVPPVAVLI